MLVPRLDFCLHVEHAFKTSSIKISTSDTCLMINSCSVFGLTSKLLHYSGKQSPYIDTATFLNFMSCRCSNKNICMHIKASASSKISPLHCIYFSSHWSRLLCTWTSIGVDSRCRCAQLWSAGQQRVRQVRFVAPRCFHTGTNIQALPFECTFIKSISVITQESFLTYYANLQVHHHWVTTRVGSNLHTYFVWNSVLALVSLRTHLIGQLKHTWICITNNNRAAVAAS